MDKIKVIDQISIDNTFFILKAFYEGERETDDVLDSIHRDIKERDIPEPFASRLEEKLRSLLRK